MRTGNTENWFLVVLPLVLVSLLGVSVVGRLLFASVLKRRGLAYLMRCVYLSGYSYALIFGSLITLLVSLLSASSLSDTSKPFDAYVAVMPSPVLLFIFSTILFIAFGILKRRHVKPFSILCPVLLLWLAINQTLLSLKVHDALLKQADWTNVEAVPHLLLILNLIIVNAQ